MTGLTAILSVTAYLSQVEATRLNRGGKPKQPLQLTLPVATPSTQFGICSRLWRFLLHAGTGTTTDLAFGPKSRLRFVREINQEANSWHSISAAAAAAIKGSMNKYEGFHLQPLRTFLSWMGFEATKVPKGRLGMLNPGQFSKEPLACTCRSFPMARNSIHGV